MAKTIQSASAILDTLSPSSINTLSDHFKAQFLATMTATLGGKPAAVPAEAPAADEATAPKRRGPKPGSKRVKAEAPAKNGSKKAKASSVGRPAGSLSGKRQRTKDGRLATEVIRDYDAAHPGAKASEVVEHCHSLGLKKVVPANVYNTRQNVAKAEAAEAAEKAARKSAKAAKAKASTAKASKKAAKKTSKKAKK